MWESVQGSVHTPLEGSNVRIVRLVSVQCSNDTNTVREYILWQGDVAKLTSIF